MLRWGYFKKNEIRQHGGFGILACQARVGDPWNVGTATDPSPGSVVQVSLKTKWWNWVNYTTKDGLAGDIVYAIAQEPSGTLWFGTNGDGANDTSEGNVFAAGAKVEVFRAGKLGGISLETPTLVQQELQQLKEQ